MDTKNTAGSFLAKSWTFLLSVLSTLWGLGKKLFSTCTSRFTKNRRFKVDEMLCYSVHSSFYLWPLILFGWVISPFIHHWPAHAVGMTWMYIWVLFYTFIMLLFDLNTIKMIVCSVVLGLFIMTAKYVEAVQHISMIGYIFAHFRSMQPVMSGGATSAMSWLLFFPWLFSLIESYRSGRKSFSPNGIEERSLLIGREITDRSGLHFSCKYPDLLETIVGVGSGSLVAYNSDNKPVREWHNIIGLYFFWDRLDEILHQRSAVVDNAKNDPVEAEIVK